MNSKEESVEAQLCFQCGSMEWTIVSDDYECKYWVRPDGHVAFRENLGKMEFVCSRCGSWTLLGVSGFPKTFRELVKLKPPQRIIRTLEFIIEGKLQVIDDFPPEEIFGWIKDYFVARNLDESGEAERFISKVENLIGRWKLLEG